MTSQCPESATDADVIPGSVMTCIVSPLDLRPREVGGFVAVVVLLVVAIFAAVDFDHVILIMPLLLGVFNILLL